ncbi:hypothetical protein Y1Q_0009588 [Alligator mississippiensis]|uniref:Uncharacterized protein n=1 Tax=Alligator mississippiensis TaxID=8496 RepID=A0A151NUG2_ALLMI|nr:hypothetical protein Y1Q_0009588 [Alligator mississippiensis]
MKQDIPACLRWALVSTVLQEEMPPVVAENEDKDCESAQKNKIVLDSCGTWDKQRLQFSTVAFQEDYIY